MEKHLDNKMYRQAQIRINKFRQVQKGQRINIGQYRQAQSNIDNYTDSIDRRMKKYLHIDFQRKKKKIKKGKIKLN